MARTYALFVAAIYYPSGGMYDLDSLITAADDDAAIACSERRLSAHDDEYAKAHLIEVRSCQVVAEWQTGEVCFDDADAWPRPPKLWQRLSAPRELVFRKETV